PRRAGQPVPHHPRARGRIRRLPRQLAAWRARRTRGKRYATRASKWYFGPCALCSTMQFGPSLLQAPPPHIRTTMKAYYHPAQALHHPQTYFTRGMMRTPQEVPDRASALVGAVKQLGFDLRQPPDAGMAPLTAVHALDYLQFLKTAH